jgi:hypothetical protein
MEELSRFNHVTIGRELRMIELKKEVNELCAGRGEAARYTLEFEEGTEAKDTADRTIAARRIAELEGTD